MIDFKQLRDHPEVFERAARLKRVTVDFSALQRLDQENRSLLQAINDQRSRLKAGSKRKPDAEQISQLKGIGNTIRELEGKQRSVEERLLALVSRIPNVPSDDTPIGEDARSNVVLREVGRKPEFKFRPREHWELGTKLGMLDVERAAQVAGTRFVYLKGDLALLQFALIQLALRALTDGKFLLKVARRAKLKVPATPFIPVIPPVFTRPEVMQKMARLEPKEERYYIPSDNLYLVGSAEHTLGPMHLDEVFDEAMLPRRYVGYSTSFRRESGSYGKDTKGMLRVHQFDKVEVESFTVSENAKAEQDFLVAIQEDLLQALGLPYRAVLLCTGDMGGPDARQIDLETWMPGQGKYRETHSADYNTDYQSRRLNTRVRRTDGRVEYVHMNDATVFAIGRTLVAIMENYQRADGSVAVPRRLQAAIGKKVIGV